jgi:hypothetical protein
MTSTRLLLNDPHGFMAWLADGRRRGTLSLADVDFAHAFAVAAVAALARRDGPERIALDVAASKAGRFAHAIGIDELVAGAVEREPTERERTVSLTRVKGRGPKEAISEKIVRLLLPDDQANFEPRSLFKYVLVELLRNVGQHSNDPAGGVVAAQINAIGPYKENPALQIVVVDNGIGIFEALRHMRPSIQTPDEALVRALEPHVSGAFPEGESGAGENAGLGLFFVAEMAKLTDGKLFVASRGATLFLDRSVDDNSQPVLTDGRAPDYPGTLIVFETAVAHVHDYDDIMTRIRDIAAQRVPRRITNRWLRFEEPPAGVQTIIIAVASEDTAEAQKFSAEVLEPRILKKTSVALDFRNVRVCTQSYVHALLHEAVRLAWAKKVPLYVTNASRAVRAQLELVENYSLGG